MDQNNDKEMYDNADKFIALANEMSKTTMKSGVHHLITLCTV
jgi:hypothetical protein